MSERKNAGYIITDVVKINDCEIVVGENPCAPSPYVCWYCRNGDDYFWGAYCGTRSAAVDVMFDRVKRDMAAIRRDVRRKEKPKNGYTKLIAEELADEVLKLKDDEEIYVATDCDECDGTLSNWYFIKRVILEGFASDFYIIDWCGGGSPYTYDCCRAKDDKVEFAEFLHEWMADTDRCWDDERGTLVVYIEKEVM